MNAPSQADCRVGGWSASTTPRPGQPAPLSPERLRARERRMIWLLMMAWIINLFDLGLTLFAWQQNFLTELNPIAARVLPHGTAATVAYKCGLLIVGTSVLWFCRRHPVTEPTVWGYVILCVGLSLWWHKVVHEAQPAWVEANTAARLIPNETFILPPLPVPADGDLPTVADAEE